MEEHLTILSDFDKLPLDTLIISPSQPKGIVQFSHGMCEHKERYLHFMNYLCENGYVCIIYDHRGHGKSVLSQDDLGYFYTDGHKAIVEDLHQLTLFIQQRYPHLPLYLFGHSMGALIVRCYLKQYDKDIDGLIISGCPSKNPATGAGLFLARTLIKLKGDHYRSQLIQKMSVDSFNKNFGSLKNSWISSDSHIVNEYNQDPLCQFIFTTQGFKSLFLLMQETYSSQHWQMKNSHLPIYFIAGENDPCITNEKKFIESISFLKEQGYDHINYQLFDKMRHETLNEINKEKVYQSILNTITSWK